MPRSARHAPARDRQARRRAYPRVRNGGAGGGWRRFRAFGRARRTCHRSRRPAHLAPPLRRTVGAAVHLRICLFLAPRFDRRRDERLFGTQGDRRRTRARKSGRCRPGDPGARFGNARGDRLRAGIGHSVRTRYHPLALRSEEHTSELQSLMRISYAVFCLKKKRTTSLINIDSIKPTTNIRTLNCTYPYLYKLTSITPN